MSSKYSVSSYKYMYLHGFASSPKSGKGQLLKNFFADHETKISLELPDLNIPSFEKLSVTAIVQQLKTEIVNSNQQYRLIGSSLGGLMEPSSIEAIKCVIVRKWLNEEHKE